MSVHRDRTGFLFLNIGHFYDHMFMLLFPTAVLAMAMDPVFGGSYAEVLTLSVFGFVAFGAASIPAGWLGDRWSKTGMMAVFFIGIGAASILTGFARSPLELAIGLTLIGLFAAIYHPVGIAMVAADAEKLGKALGINGVWGNLGVAAAGITAGALADLWGWRAVFILPGLISIATGIAYVIFARRQAAKGIVKKPARAHIALTASQMKLLFGVVIVATLCGGIIFHATTVGLPKLIAERTAEFAGTTTQIGALVTAIYVIAACAQIVVGHLIDRYPLKLIYVGVIILQLPLFIIAANAEGTLMVAAAIGMMLLVFGAIPINDAIVARYGAAEWRSRMYAAKYVLSLGVSAAAVPMIAGLHQGGGGFATLMLVLAVLAAIITLAAALMPTGASEKKMPAPAAAE